MQPWGQRRRRGRGLGWGGQLTGSPEVSNSFQSPKIPFGSLGGRGQYDIPKGTFP